MGRGVSTGTSDISGRIPQSQTMSARTSKAASAKATGGPVECKRSEKEEQNLTLGDADAQSSARLP